MWEIIIIASIIVAAIAYLGNRYYKILTGKKSCCDSSGCTSHVPSDKGCGPNCQCANDNKQSS